MSIVVGRVCRNNVSFRDITHRLCHPGRTVGERLGSVLLVLIDDVALVLLVFDECRSVDVDLTHIVPILDVAADAHLHVVRKDCYGDFVLASAYQVGRNEILGESLSVSHGKCQFECYLLWYYDGAVGGACLNCERLDGLDSCRLCCRSLHAGDVDGGGSLRTADLHACDLRAAPVIELKNELGKQVLERKHNSRRCGGYSLFYAGDEVGG